MKTEILTQGFISKQDKIYKSYSDAIYGFSTLNVISLVEITQLTSIYKKMLCLNEDCSD